MNRSAVLPGLARLSVAGCAPFLALVQEERAQALADWNCRRGGPLQGVNSMAALLRHWPLNAPVLAAAVPDPQHSLDLRHFRVHAPVEPAQVYCTIGNYRAQLLEAMLDGDADASVANLPARRAAHLQAIDARGQGEPYVCLKPNGSIADPFAPLVLEPGEDTLDWEVEVGVVIGSPARHILTEDAMAHVAGFCTVNDITLRQRLFRAEPKGLGTDFLQAKGGPGWLPVGPVLVPAPRVADAEALQLRLVLNGQTMQEGRAGDMLFDIAQQIAYLSRHVRLHPGDLVCTGSPAGFGAHYKRFLRDGDIVEAEVAGLGTQRTAVRRLRA